MSGRLIVSLMAALSVPLLAGAQEPPSTSAPAQAEAAGCALHPAPECRYFGVTEIGLAFGSARKTTSIFDTKASTEEFFIEGGVMRNLGGHDAVGVTWFLALDNAAGSTGLGTRYRRWMTRRQSLDVGIGVPVASSDYDTGTLLGSIRYSPNQLIGLTVRPERIRHTRFDCVGGMCVDQPDNHFRVLVGGDLSGKAGAVVMAWYGVAAGVMTVVLILTLNG